MTIVRRVRKVVLSSSPPVGDNDGLVVSDYANYDPDAAIFQSLDINETLDNWGTNGGSDITFANEAWWNGTARVATMYPPTESDRGSGIGSVQLWKEAAKANHQANIRWEWKVSDDFCLDSTTFPKWIIVRTYQNLSTGDTGGVDRPMLFIENMNEASNGSIDIANTLQFCPAQGTKRMYSSTNLTPAPRGDDWVDGGNGPTTYCSMRQPFYVRATSGVDGGGNPIIAASEILCTEMRMNTVATADEPLGFIGMRTYRRNGQVFERGCSWKWDENKVLGYYIADIDNMGGGYYNVGQPHSSGLWTKMGRRLGIALNYEPTLGRAWKGPPSGFVQV